MRVLILCALTAVAVGACTPSSSAEYACMETLLSGAIAVHWKLSADEASVSFEAEATGSGWLALGFGTSMTSGTAMVALDGSVPVLHSLQGYYPPPSPLAVDRVGYSMLSQSRSAGRTVLKFTRPLAGMALDKVDMMAAYHGTSENMAYHGPDKKATFSIALGGVEATTGPVTTTTTSTTGQLASTATSTTGQLASTTTSTRGIVASTTTFTAAPVTTTTTSTTGIVVSSTTSTTGQLASTATSTTGQLASTATSTADQVASTTTSPNDPVASTTGIVASTTGLSLTPSSTSITQEPTKTPSTPACTPSSSAEYACMETLLSGAIAVHWKLSADEASVSFEAEATGSGWLALGFGTSMTSGTAMVALDGSVPVLHSLQGYYPPPSPLAVDRVGYSMLSQSRSAGRTVLKFTRPLAGMALDKVDMMAAYHGTSENMAYHGPDKKATFSIALGGVESTTPTPPSTPPSIVTQEPTAVLSTPAPKAAASGCEISALATYSCVVGVGGGAQMHYAEDYTTADRRRVALEIGGGGWYSLAWPTKAGKMAPAAALVVEGEWEGGTTRRVRIDGDSAASISSDPSVLPHVTDVALNVVNGKRVLSFLLSSAVAGRDAAVLSSGRSSVVSFNWATSWVESLNYHGTSRGSLTVDFDSGAAVVVRGAVPGKVKTHVIVMFILWGILAPCGVLLKHVGPRFLPGLMPYYMHGAAMTVVAIGTTVMMVHATSNLNNDSVHKLLGTLITLVMWVQILLAVTKRWLAQNASAAGRVGTAHRCIGLVTYPGLALGQIMVGVRDYNNRYGSDALGARIQWFALVGGLVVACAYLFVFVKGRRSATEGKGAEGGAEESEPTEMRPSPGGSHCTDEL
eukprot:TRINITY_DN8557_c0_g1_i3.p1 TRINITY_DN8557_c0_g1~~TRINITY_DN8557_c0_g1_i3.p1  ORF type:complete len:860 (+),score=97.12 TRINITY_DN8557_c0_g1_i3:74-2653(+)